MYHPFIPLFNTSISEVFAEIFITRGKRKIKFKNVSFTDKLLVFSDLVWFEMPLIQ